MFFALTSYASFVLQALELHLARRRLFYVFFSLVLIVLGVFYAMFLAPARGFPEGTIVEIEEGMSVPETISLLEERNVISFGLLFKALVRITGTDRNLHAGKYLFAEPAGMLEVLFRMANGLSGIPVTRVTFPEGMTAREMAEELEEELPSFDSGAFLALATPYEGYLFPDTYDFYADVTVEEIVERLRETYAMKMETLRNEIEASGRSEEEIVIMASLLEREAKTLEEKRMVAGILWDRIELGMALQVDAVFGYIHGVRTYHPSLDDLEVDSPYNTYRYPGLPPGAIANPGLESLLAAVTPTDSEYLYYLTGDDGKMYYAETFEGHKENRELYLD